MLVRNGNNNKNLYRWVLASASASWVVASASASWVVASASWVVASASASASWGCGLVTSLLPAYMFKRLQSVLNAAARLVLQLPGCQSVSIPMAEKLHWLGFPHRVTYKLYVLVYKGLHGLAPDYLSRRCVRVHDVPGHAHLRSASAGQLMVPIMNKKMFGDKGFSHCDPVAWNNLPLDLWTDDCTPSLDCFKKHLKMALFKLTTQK